MTAPQTFQQPTEEKEYQILNLGPTHPATHGHFSKRSENGR